VGFPPTLNAQPPMGRDTAPRAALLLRAERWVGAIHRDPLWVGAIPGDRNERSHSHRPGILGWDGMSKLQIAGQLLAGDTYQVVLAAQNRRGMRHRAISASWLAMNQARTQKAWSMKP